MASGMEVSRYWLDEMATFQRSAPQTLDPETVWGVQWQSAAAYQSLTAWAAKQLEKLTEDSAVAQSVVYIKHSLRKVHTPCGGCGSDDLYFAHEQVGNPSPTSETYCSRCKAEGPLVLVDMDTL